MAKDLYHEAVKVALEKEGWAITHDYYQLDLKSTGNFMSNLEIDLGAEKLFAAEKGLEKIAVEIKTLSIPSVTYALHNLVGQYINYRIGLKLQEPDRKLFIAIPNEVYQVLAPQPFFQLIVSENKMNLIVYEPDNQTINAWYI